MNSLKRIIFLVLFLVSLLSSLIPLAYFSYKVESKLKEESIADIKKEYLISIEFLRSSNILDISSLDSVLKKLSKLFSSRFTFIDEKGVVISDSYLDLSKIKYLDNHYNRPELIEARKSNYGVSIRYSDTIDTYFIYIASKQSIGSFKGYLRMARPYSQLQRVVQSIEQVAWFLICISFLLSLGISILFSRKISKRIYSLSLAAKDFSEGKRSKFVSDISEFSYLVQALNNMANNLSEKIELIESQKRELENVLNNIQEGVVVIDKHMNLVRSNRSFREMVKREEIEGKSFLEVVLNKSLQNKVEDILSKDCIEVVSFRTEMEKEFFEVKIIPFEFRRDKFYILVFYNISEILKLEKIKRDFFTNASHEMRTPLTSIKGYIETLLNNEDILKNRGKEILEVVKRNSEQMSNLLDDILQLSKLETEKEIIDIEPVDVHSLIDRLLQEFKVRIEAKKVEFKKEIAQNFPLVLANNKAIYHVLQNLIDNALKYGLETKGELKIVAEETPLEFKIGVIDDGPGIPPDEQKRIFERFYRGEKVEVKPKGSGLGLAICKHIINKLGGRIWLESPVKNNRGCAFWFTLPKRREEDKNGESKN